VSFYIFRRRNSTQLLKCFIKIRQIIKSHLQGNLGHMSKLFTVYWSPFTVYRSPLLLRYLSCFLIFQDQLNTSVGHGFFLYQQMTGIIIADCIDG